MSVTLRAVLFGVILASVALGKSKKDYTIFDWLILICAAWGLGGCLKTWYLL